MISIELILDQARLAKAVKAVCPCELGGDNTLQPYPDATAQQIADAQAIIDGWDTSPAARAARQVADERLDAVAELARADRKLLRAFILLMLDELNGHAATINSLLTAIDNAASLAQLKVAVALIADYPTRTAQQLRTAITNRITAGDADA